MQFDLQINRKLDRLSEIVKIKSAWRGIKILCRFDPSGDLQMTKPVPTVPDVPPRCSGLIAFKAFHRYAPFKSFKTSED
jgi:hypothetical protein